MPDSRSSPSSPPISRVPDGSVYLDHAATAPMPEPVAALVAELLARGLGNPSGTHSRAREAKTLLEAAREDVADMFGCSAAEVVFTSGGTEADNWSVRGAVDAAPPNFPVHLVAGATEHKAVLAPLRAVASGRGSRPGVRSDLVPVDREGVLDLDALAARLSPDTALVSVMAVNNETGVRGAVADVARLVREAAPGAWVHTDAVQALPWLRVSEAAAGADLITVSAHKVGGPVGVGALVVRAERDETGPASGSRRRDPAGLAPLLRGGAQERDRRAGTQNAVGAAAFAAALHLVDRDRARVSARVCALRDRLEAGVSAVEGVTVDGADAPRVPGISHLTIAGVLAHELLVVLDAAGICVSAGASCASGAPGPSHVMTAMGRSDADARGGVRFSFGPMNTDADVDAVLAILPVAVERLRSTRTFRVPAAISRRSA